MANLRRAYSRQKASAKLRGIDWLFTYETWAAVWQPYAARRGKCRDCLVMGRIGDAGPYSPDNVQIVTYSENLKDRVKYGSFERGSERHTAKLTEADIPRVRDLIASGVAKQKIADWFGVTRNTVRQIADGTTWRYA